VRSSFVTLAEDAVAIKIVKQPHRKAGWHLVKPVGKLVNLADGVRAKSRRESEQEVRAPLVIPVHAEIRSEILKPVRSAQIQASYRRIFERLSCAQKRGEVIFILVMQVQRCRRKAPVGFKCIVQGR